MAMRIGVAVDCGCDLPYDYFRKHGITILPGTVKFKTRDFTDDRKEGPALEVYGSGLRDLAPGEDAAAVTAEHIRDVFLGRLVRDYDYVFCLTTASGRAPVYLNALQAASRILSEYRPIRAKNGVDGNFALRVLDTQSMGGGYAVLCAETINRIGAGDAPAEIRGRIEQLIPDTYTYHLVRDFAAVRKRLREKGDRSIGLMQFMIGQALDMKPLIMANRNETKAVTALRGFENGARRCFEFLGERIRAGLKVPAVSIAYGGDLRELKALPGYAEAMKVAEEHGVTVYTSMMCISTAAYGSPGSLGFGFCAPPHVFE